MQKRILVSEDSYETRIAILEDSQLVEYFFERGDSRRITGNIYKGRVTSVLPGIEAVFVDIGLGRNAFLYLADVNKSAGGFDQLIEEFIGYGDEEPSDFESDMEEVDLPPISIGEILKVGQEILVQMEKEPIGSKGARVKMNISLPGRYVVLLPVTSHVGVSRKIDEEYREEMKLLGEEIVPHGMGLIMRTACVGRSKTELEHEISYLKAEWQRILKISEKSKAPSIIHQDLGTVARLVRDVLDDEVSEFWVDSFMLYEEICNYAKSIVPSLLPCIKFYSNKIPLFKQFGVDGKIENLRHKKIWLGCGGYIIIDETEALTTIDVNTGRYLGKHNLEETVLNANLEAADEIARQIRLRDIGGIIVIDFIDMESRGNQNLVLERLEESLLRDRARTQILSLTKLGLVEMTRKRVRKSLNRTISQDCPYCKGEGMILSLETMVVKVLRRIEECILEDPCENIAVDVHPQVATALVVDHSHDLESLQDKYSVRIEVYPSRDLHFEAMSFYIPEDDDKSIASDSPPQNIVEL